MPTRREQRNQEAQEKSKLEIDKHAHDREQREQARQTPLIHAIENGKSLYNDGDLAGAIIELKHGIVKLLESYRYRNRGGPDDAITKIRKEMMELYIQWQGEMVIQLIAGYTDSLKSHPEAEELCNQLISHNDTFLSKIHSIESKSWVVDYKHDFYLALEQYQKNYRESISKARDKLSSEVTREPETVGEHILDSARRFFNLIDVFFTFIFRKEKTMDETYTPIAQTLTGKAHFFNRLVTSIYNCEELGVKIDQLTRELGNTVDKISSEVDELRYLEISRDGRVSSHLR